MERRVEVEVSWDAEAGVWYVSDSDVPGLATGADTMEELLAKLKHVIPELLEENGMLSHRASDVPFDLTARRSDSARFEANG